MEQNYTKAQLIQAGFDITKILTDMATKENEGNSFLKTYLDSLTSEDGIYKKQSDALQEFSSANREIENTTHEILQSIHNSSTKIDGISDKFCELNEKMSEIQIKRRKMDQKMNELEDFIKKIKVFIQEIQNISEKINLLSFNASIEAAHAGSAGAGFRIIANEVKNLSEQTKSTSDSIAKNIEDLTGHVGAVISGNAQYDDFLNQMKDLAENSTAYLEDIKKDSQQNARATESMYESVQSAQENILRSSKEVEESNIRQVREIANRETEASIMTNDRLSFLLELNKLFLYMQTRTF